MIGKLPSLLLIAVIFFALAYFGSTYLFGGNFSQSDDPASREEQEHQELLARLREKRSRQEKESNTNSVSTVSNKRIIDIAKSEESQSIIPKVILPTERITALEIARSSTGKQSPFSPPAATKPFPRQSREESTGAKHPIEMELPPPPPDTLSSDSRKNAAHESPVDAAMQQPPEPLAHDELPIPPLPPLLMRSFELSAIIGDRAILRYRRKNHKQSLINLGEGESFNTVKLVAVNKESVVLEEDGRRKELELPAIR